MKKEIHPKYYGKATVKCVCGNSFTVGSTKEKIEVEVCSACHPFFTGKEKVMDTAGRVEKFRARQKQASGPVVKKPKPKVKVESKTKTEVKKAVASKKA